MNCYFITNYLFTIRYNYLKFKFISTICVCMYILLPSKLSADCVSCNLNIDIAKTYFQQNPYIIAPESTMNERYYFQIVKIEHVYLQNTQLTISGKVVLTWKENMYKQRTYTIPDSGLVYSGEVCCDLYGYYKPLRAAFMLHDIFNASGGEHYNYSNFMSFPSPEVLPNIEKHYTLWMDQLAPTQREYCEWWYTHASVGPPVMHELIDSVLSIPEGGRKSPPSLFVDYNHCPFEGCRYGTWKTTQNISIYNNPHSQKVIGTIQANDTFTAITGNIYLTPLQHIAQESFEVYDSVGSVIIEPGRTYYVLSYIGEGHSKIWLNGRILIDSESYYNNTQQWWVHIQTKKGKKGWIRYPSDGSIQGSDALE